MIVIGIDPGNIKSAFVLLEQKYGKDWRIVTKGILLNREVVQLVLAALQLGPGPGKHIVIEKIVNYNQKVGASVFDTCEWVGRFKESWENEPNCLEIMSMPRKAAVGYLCEFGHDGDKHVRKALIKRFGEPSTKAKPGVLYDFSSHTWAALAIAVTYIDKFLEVK